jgi:hypothetical protein
MATVGVINVDDLIKRYERFSGSSQLRVEFPNLKQALRALDEFPRGIRRKWTRMALSAGAGVLRDAAKRYVPKETRLLERSLGVKVSIPRNPNRPAYALVGARRRQGRVVASVKGQVRTLTARGTTKRLQSGRKARFRDPVRYLHLVENPHVIRGGGMTEGSHFLAKALANAGQAAEAKAISKIKEGVQVESARVRAATAPR